MRRYSEGARTAALMPRCWCWGPAFRPSGRLSAQVAPAVLPSVSSTTQRHALPLRQPRSRTAARSPPSDPRPAPGLVAQLAPLIASVSCTHPPPDPTVLERAEHIAEWVRLTDLISAQLAPISKTTESVWQVTTQTQTMPVRPVPGGVAASAGRDEQSAAGSGRAAGRRCPKASPHPSPLDGHASAWIS
jgi:hypothetical protein